ncbi:MAG: hypothetical protein IJ710_09670 [Prevotella sp.]|nr:hypothetical protein [Prevotella sp.]
MKKMMIALMAMLTIAATANAMSYEQARNEALFLTDKMAYELNLTDEQYEAVYEINLDYLMGVTSYDDVYGAYWDQRNLDMSYVLLSWQLEAFRAATYFYRPLYWDAGYWHFGVYARYPRRDYFFFGRPAFYASYRGGHSWHMNGGRSWYHARRDHFRPAPGHHHFGMRDGWNRGDFRGGRVNPGHHSSTRTTVHNNGRPNPNGGMNHGNGGFGHNNGRGSFGASRNNGGGQPNQQPAGGGQHSFGGGGQQHNGGMNGGSVSNSNVMQRQSSVSQQRQSSFGARSNGSVNQQHLSGSQRQSSFSQQRQSSFSAPRSNGNVQRSNSSSFSAPRSSGNVQRSNSSSFSAPRNSSHSSSFSGGSHSNSSRSSGGSHGGGFGRHR